MTAVITLGLLAALATAAPAQLVRAPGRGVRPQLTLGDTLTMSASPTTLSITLVKGGTATASTPIATTVSWTGISLLSSFDTYAYFVSATSALSGSSPVSYIPTSCVLGQVTTGLPTTATAFTQTNPFGGAGASLHLISVGTILSLGGSRTDNLVLSVNLSTLPQLPAAAYTGTLYLQAQAF